MDMKHKSFTGLKITDEAKGEVEAVFATLGVKDHDGDVTLKGAFENGEEVRLSAYNHESWKGALPVGKGRIEEVGDNVVFHGKFFMDTTGGKDTFHTVKEMGSLQEWSYGYDTLEQEPGQKDGERVNLIKKQKVHEVSPVILGAGIGTHTSSVKAKEDSEEMDQQEETSPYKGMKFGEHVKSVVTGIDELAERAASVVTLRTEQGKSSPLSSEAAELLTEVEARLETVKGLLQKQNDTNNDEESVTDEVEAEWLKFIAQDYPQGE